MNAQFSLLLVGSLCCFVLALTQSAQAAPASIASSNQESNEFQSNQQQQRESIAPLMTSDDQEEQSGIYQGARVMESLAPNSPYQQERMDRIKFALAKFLADSPYAANNGPYQMYARIQTRSVPNAINDHSISSMLESFDRYNQQDQRGAIQTRDEHQRLAPGASGPTSVSSGHKTIRNAQPVFMRLPPRFGKRSYWA